ELRTVKLRQLVRRPTRTAQFLAPSPRRRLKSSRNWQLSAPRRLPGPSRCSSRLAETCRRHSVRRRSPRLFQSGLLKARPIGQPPCPYECRKQSRRGNEASSVTPKLRLRAHSRRAVRPERQAPVFRQRSACLRLELCPCCNRRSSVKSRMCAPLYL